MQQVQVDHVRAQPTKGILAAALQPCTARIAGIDLADQKQPVPIHVPNGLADQNLRRAVTVHFCRVDQRHARLNARLQRSHFLLCPIRVLPQKPCTLTNTGQLAPVHCLHPHMLQLLLDLFPIPHHYNVEIEKPKSLAVAGGIKWARTIDLHDVNVAL